MLQCKPDFVVHAVGFGVRLSYTVNSRNDVPPTPHAHLCPCLQSNDGFVLNIPDEESCTVVIFAT